MTGRWAWWSGRASGRSGLLSWEGRKDKRPGLRSARPAPCPRSGRHTDLQASLPLPPAWAQVPLPSPADGCEPGSPRPRGSACRTLRGQLHCSPDASAFVLTESPLRRLERHSARLPLAAVWVDLVSLSCRGSLGTSWWKDPVHSPPVPLAAPHAGTADSRVCVSSRADGDPGVPGSALRPSCPSTAACASPRQFAFPCGWCRRPLLSQGSPGDSWSSPLPRDLCDQPVCLPGNTCWCLMSEFGEASISVEWGRPVHGQAVSIRGFHGLGMWV